MKTLNMISLAAMLGLAMLMSSSIFATEGCDVEGTDGCVGRGDGPVVYVTSQDLYYDTVVLHDLPMKGDFQQLFVPNLTTEFGPGDEGYLGGRWWIDLNGNGIMDGPNEDNEFMGDKFFMCPLLGPGRDAP